MFMEKNNIGNHMYHCYVSLGKRVIYSTMIFGVAFCVGAADE